MTEPEKPQFWIVEPTPSRPRPHSPSGCDLCEHCTMLRLMSLAGRSPSPSLATESRP